MPKDATSISGVEHREWHNLYGFYQQMATSRGLVERHKDQNERPFVLSELTLQEVNDTVPCGRVITK